MSLPVTLPSIRPISDLRTHLQEIEEDAHSTGQPIVLTRNGKPSLVVLDSKSYDEGIRRERALSKLREAEIEAKYRGESVPLADVKARIATIIDAGRAYANS